MPEQCVKPHSYDCILSALLGEYAYWLRNILHLIIERVKYEGNSDNSQKSAANGYKEGIKKKWSAS